MRYILFLQDKAQEMKSAPTSAQTIQGRVVRVADGDTITILDGAKVQSKIRLNRIDVFEEEHAFGDMEMVLSNHSYFTNGVCAPTNGAK